MKLEPQQKQAIAYPGTERFRTFNHGEYDADLLCARCDGVLGEHERKAFRALNAGREANAHGGQTLPLKISGDDLLLFCAAVVWKYAATDSYKMSIGGYLSSLRDALFDGAPLPQSVDAFGARVWTGDDQVYYYREPLRERTLGVNFVRFSLGGFLFHLKLDKRLNPPLPSSLFWMRGKEVANMLVVPLHESPDWKDLQALRGNTRLQSFLARNEPRSS